MKETVLKVGDNFYDWCLQNNRQDLIEEFNEEDVDVRDVIFCHRKNGEIVKYHWKCKECGYEYCTSIYQRVFYNTGCKSCFTTKLNKRFNEERLKNGGSIADKFPQLLDEWDYELNEKEGITPENVTYGSQQPIHWICKNNHRYISKANAKTGSHCSCPECSKYTQTSFSEQALFFYVKKYFPQAVNSDTHLGIELDVYIPELDTGIEYDGYLWHIDKAEQEQRKNDIANANIAELIRIRENGLCDYDDVTVFFRNSNTSDKSLQFIIGAVLTHLGIKNPDLDIVRDRREIVDGYQYTVNKKSFGCLYPEIASQWDYEANGSALPTDFGPNSKYEANWILHYIDPETGKEFDLKWTCRIADRVIKGIGCPYLSNKAVWPGLNDFETINPEAAKLFNNTMNGNATTKDFTSGCSSKRFYWDLDCGHTVYRAPYQMNGVCQCDKCHKKMNLKGTSRKLAA